MVWLLKLIGFIVWQPLLCMLRIHLWNQARTQAAIP
jgi:hypothetical protein